MMAGPTGSVVLRLFEEGMAAGPAGRAALLCRAAGGEAERLSLGDVDRSIWRLVGALFDGRHEAVSTCAICGEAMEFALPETFDLPPRSGSETVEVHHSGSVHPVRMPRIGDIRRGRIDLAALAPAAPWEEPAFVAAAEAALEDADPGLRITLALECGACGARQEPVFDIPGYAWGRIEQAGRRLVRDVSRLARAFGWSETDILAMTAQRRAMYLAEIGE